MKKTLLLTILAITGLVILIESGVLNYLIMFVLVGAVPGTSYNVPPTIMLLATIVLSWIVIFRLASLETFYHVTTKRLVTRHLERKKRLPRRRYGQI